MNITAKEKSDISPEGESSVLMNERVWEQTFDAVSDLILIVDHEHTITRVNRSMAERCHCTPAELIGRKCFEVVHGATSVPAYCAHSIITATGEPQALELGLDPLQGVFDINISPMFDADGSVVATVHIAREITDKKRQDELVASQQRQLEELNSSLESRIEMAVAELRKKDDILIQQSRLTAMGEMISSIAHQWRQPLNNIGLIVQSLQLAFRANDLNAEELNEDVADIMKVIQQMSETINDFRDFFSHEEHAASFSINELFTRVLSFIEPSLNKNGIRLELQEELDVTAVGFPNEFVQTLLNIILNARDALLAHQPNQPLITVRIFREEGRSMVTVRDNGGGINEAILPKIFDPYFTTKKQGTGAGIGLYMAKMIVEKKMNGRLLVRNIDGGTEFRIEM